MPVRCSQCGALTVWDDSVGSAVCTSCGSLKDPSQSVLTSSHYGSHNDTTEPSLWDPSASATLKSLRTGSNWDLAGQGKESRDRKNAYAMADFIKSLAVSFNATGLSPRAITLFTQAKSASNFRWGQKSRSVAAACLAIALRESNRPDSIRDIASILKVPAASVSREFTAITSTLKLSLTLVDPSVHISTLQNHLASTLKEHREASALPSTLVNSLQTLCMRSAARTAVSLSQLLARFSPNHDVLRLPAAPTACGIFILALEAENRSVLNPLGDLAQFLGSPCYAAKSVVMARYKIVQDEIARWIDRVPWLDKYESKKGRAKVSKRVVVARGLKDVIKSQEEIWQRRIRPLLDADLGTDEDQSDVEQHFVTASHKRPRLNQALTKATHFLLDPIGHSVSPTFASSSKGSYTATPSQSAPALSLATYILTNPSTSCIRRPPTRLQLLAQDRGGVSEDQIPDDDLFYPGEFEGLLRNDEEIRVLRGVFGWDEDGDTSQNSQPITNYPSRTIRKRLREEPNTMEQATDVFDMRPKKRSRIDMEALAQFLADGSRNVGEDQAENSDTEMLGLGEVMYNVDYDNDDLQNDYSAESNFPVVGEGLYTQPLPQGIGRNNDDAEELILENWRPLSPEVSAGTDLQYEEEYD